MNGTDLARAVPAIIERVSHCVRNMPALTLPRQNLNLACEKTLAPQCQALFLG